MKTSSTQFEMMVAFMEQYGDLCRPSKQSKLYIYQKWEELSVLLNSDGSGEHKNTEKWRKVWTDLKNNTKKKSVRIHHSARGTDGGPATTLKLSAIEERVLKIMNIHSATDVEEVFVAGQPQDVGAYCDTNTSQQHNVLNTTGDEKVGVTCIIDDDGYYKESISTAPQSTVNRAPRSTRPATTERPIPSQRSRLLTASHRGSPRRRVCYRPYTPADRAAREFLHSDKEWRKFHMEKNRQQLALEQERLRLRALELQLHNRLADIGDRVVDILNRFLGYE